VTNLISVVTAVHAPAMRYLGDAYTSLASQVLPDGWDWQWVVQEDGTTGEALTHLPNDDRISVGVGRPLGQGIARTVALSRADGSLIRVLDSDDQLTPDALAREIDVFRDFPRTGWTTCRVLDLLPDGTTAGFEGDPPAGKIERGAVLAYWREHNYRASVHPATLCMRRELLVALGGWMALPAGEDTGLLLALSAVSDGYFVPEPGMFYRKWPGQVTAQAAHTEPGEWKARNRIIDERAETLGRMFAGNEFAKLGEVTSG